MKYGGQIFRNLTGQNLDIVDQFLLFNLMILIVVVLQQLLVLLLSNIKLAQAPGNVLLSRKETGLSKDSVANISQIITIDRSFLTECVGSLSSKYFTKIEDGLRLVLSL